MEGMGRCVTQGGSVPQGPCTARASCGLMGRSEVPSIVLLLHPPPAPHPLDPIPLSPPSLSLTCPSSLFASTPGLEQLRNLRHLDVAYNLLEAHRELSPLWPLAELQKVRLGCFKDLGASLAPVPPSHAAVVSALHPTGRPKAHLCLLLAPQLYLEGNPLWFHPAHRVATAQYLSPRVRDAVPGVSDPLVSALLSLSWPVPPPPLHLLPFPTPSLVTEPSLEPLLMMLLPSAEPDCSYRPRRAPAPAWSSPRPCAPPTRPPPPLSLLSSFLMEKSCH